MRSLPDEQSATYRCLSAIFDRSSQLLGLTVQLSSLGLTLFNGVSQYVSSGLAALGFIFELRKQHVDGRESRNHLLYLTDALEQKNQEQKKQQLYNYFYRWWKGDENNVFYGIRDGKVEEIEPFLKHDYPINQPLVTGKTPLFFSVVCGINHENVEVIFLLLRYGADPNQLHPIQFCTISTVVLCAVIVI